MPSDARTGRLLEMTRNRGRGKMPRYRQNKATRVRREAVMRGLSIHLAYSYTVSQLLSGGILGGNREGSAFERVELVAKRRGLALPSLPPARRDKGGASLLHRRAVPATTYPPRPPPFSVGSLVETKERRRRGKLCAAGAEHNNYTISFQFTGCAIHEIYCTVSS